MDGLWDAAPCGILVFNDGGTILSANRTLTRMLGYAAAELQGRSLDTILTTASRIFYNTHFFPLVRMQSKADEIYLTLITKDNADLPVLCNIVRRESAAGHENIVVFMPVFQRRKYEEEILQARRKAETALQENKELQDLTLKLEQRTRELEVQNQWVSTTNADLIQFSKIISHDFQEPIRKIRLFCDMLTSNHEHHTPEMMDRALARIQMSAERLVHLTAGLHQYLNIDNDASIETVDLDIPVSRALEKIRKSTSFDEFEVQRDKLPIIEGYLPQMELLFYHLFDNALKFRKPDEKLKIEIAHTLLDENVYRSMPDKYRFVEHVRILFKDNGIGFDNQYKDYVFGLVKKISSDTKDLGTGLALIRKIVHNHSGTVDVQAAKGTGTTVILVFPLVLQR